MTSDELASFYDHWYPHVKRYMRWKTNGSADADDVTQDVFTGLADKRARLKLETAERYMWVTAKHSAVNYRTRAAKRASSPYDPTVHAGLLSTPSPEREVIERIIINETLAPLNDRERVIVDRTVMNDQTDVVVAQELHVSPERISKLRMKALIVLSWGYSSVEEMAA